MAATARPISTPRPRTRRSGVAQGLVAVLALLVTAGGAVVLIAPALGRSAMASAGQAGPHAALPVLLAGAALVGAGAIAWFGRPDRTLALIAFIAAGAWLGLELEASPSVIREARTVGMVIAPFFTPLVAHLPIRALAADRRASPVALLLAVVYVLTAAASIAHALTYDPFFDVDCSPVCAQGDNVVAIAQDARLADSSGMLGHVAALLGSIGLVIWSIVRLSRPRTLDRVGLAVVLAAGAVGSALAWWTAARIWSDPALPAESPLLEPAIATAIAVAGLGAAVSALVASEMRRAEASRRIAAAITAGAGSASLRETLSRTVRDDRLRVAYPVDDGGSIDEAGMPIEGPLPGPGRAVTAIERGGSTIALVEHATDLDPELLVREIGAAARLAIDNERLEATIRSRLRELQASRARIVEAGDVARGRLERDLHDGAQQRLLAVSFELRLAAAAAAQAEASAEALAALDQDIEEVDRALEELRDLAHGIHAVVLTEDGLSGAIASVAEEAPIAVEIAGQVGRCPATTELAAYLAVVEGVRRVREAAGERLDISLAADDGVLHLEFRGPGLGDAPWVRIEDRVGAAGGELNVRDDPSGHARVVIVLPCA
jgi:signal transduction histidine kinase